MRKKIYNIKNRFIKLKEEKIDNIILITLPNLENITLNKLSKYITLNIIIIVLNYLGLIYLTYRGINIFVAKILIEIVFIIINMLRKML